MLILPAFRNIMWQAFQDNGLPGMSYTHPTTGESFNPSQRMAYAFADALFPSVSNPATVATFLSAGNPNPAIPQYSLTGFNPPLKGIESSATCGWSTGKAHQLFTAIYEGTFEAIKNVNIQVGLAESLTILGLSATLMNIHYSVDFSSLNSLTSTLTPVLQDTFLTHLAGCEHTPARDAMCREASKQLASMLSTLKYDISAVASNASPTAPTVYPPTVSVFLS